MQVATKGAGKRWSKKEEENEKEEIEEGIEEKEEEEEDQREESWTSNEEHWGAMMSKEVWGRGGASRSKNEEEQG